MGGVAQASAEVAVATINTAAAIYIADRQLDIAQEAQDIANKLNEHMCENYYPCEIKLLNEVCNEPLAEVDYEEQAGRFSTTAKLQYAKLRDELDKQFSRYCCGNHMRLLKDLALMEARGITDNVNYGYRVAEQRAQALNDLRFNKMFQALGMGRGLASTAISYAQVAGSQFSSLGTQASQAASQALNQLGFSNRGTQATQGVTYTPQSNQFNPVQYTSGTPTYSLPANNFNYGVSPTEPFAVGGAASSYSYYGVTSDYYGGNDLLGDSFGLGQTG